MVHHFDHRFATYERDGTIRDTTLEEHQDPTFAPMPRYWVEEEEVEERLVKRDRDGNVVWRWEQPWLLGFRRIARSTDERTAIFALIPRVGTGDPLPVVFTAAQHIDNALLLGALASSLVFDYVARQAVGGTHLDLFIAKQLPMPAPDDLEHLVRERLLLLARELVCVGGWAPALGCLSDVVSWDTATRDKRKTELNAICFHLFGLSAAEAAHVLDSFEVLARRDVSDTGGYATRDAILTALEELRRV